jgi:dihydroflavonol-4-reductase
LEILITGATGFAGNVLLDLLPRTVRYTKITVFVLPGDPGQARMRNKGIQDLEIVHGDICDARAVDRAVAGHSHVIHLAGLISYWNRDRAKLVRVNQRGVENVVDACIRHGVSRLIHVASVGTIGFNRDGSPADEETEFNWPESFAYMTTKRAGQQVVERAVRERKLPAVILNPASLMGPGDPIADTPHNQLYDRIRNKVLFGCFAGGLAVTDVRDLALIIIKALSTGRVGEKYLVVGANVTYREVVEAIGACFHRKVYPFPVPWFILAWAGRAMEWLSMYTGRRPPLTWAYGRLSGWFSYYSNAKSRGEFAHDYIPFEATVADGCTYFEKDLGGGKA